MGFGVAILRKDMMKNAPFVKNKPISENWWGDVSTDRIQILLKLAWIVSFTIQLSFRRIYVESLKLNGAYNLPTN